MIRRLVFVLAAALSVVALSACSVGGGGSESSAPMPGVEIAPDSRTLDAPADAGPSAEPSVITTGSLTLIVGDPVSAVTDVREIARTLGGSVEQETVTEATASAGPSATMLLRVPADEFDAAFAALADVGEPVAQNRSATDVTLQRVDLEARVAALQASVDRLTALMAGAATTGELIEAESALAQRQQELDGLRAQLDALTNQVEMSTIWVSLETKRALPGGPANFWEGLLAGLQSIVTAASAGLVIVGILLPWLVLGGVVALVVVLIVRAARRRGR